MEKIKIRNEQSGFTLIELIVAMILIGILAVGLTLGFVVIIQNYLFAQEAAQASQKAQLAMARIKKELSDATAINGKEASYVVYTRPKSPPSCMADAGCMFRIKKDKTAISLGICDATGSVTSEQILIDHIAEGVTFLTFKDYNGAAWSLSGGSIDDLASVTVSFSITYGANQTLPFSTIINPRGGSKQNIPSLN